VLVNPVSSYDLRYVYEEPCVPMLLSLLVRYLNPYFRFQKKFHVFICRMMHLRNRTFPQLESTSASAQ